MRSPRTLRYHDQCYVRVEQSAITPEMAQLFEERTQQHIRFVQQYAAQLAQRFPELAALPGVAALHDASKFSPGERPGYIHTTWSYKHTGKPASRDLTGPSWTHHKQVNDHHPEHWPDVTAMPDLALAHAVADWAAMSMELGTSLTEWVTKHALTRWAWSPAQVARIRELVAATGRP